MNQETHTEEFSINGKGLLAPIKTFLQEGKIRRTLIHNKQERTFKKIHLTMGMAALGAITVLVTEAQYPVEKVAK